MRNPLDDIKYFFRGASLLSILVLINIGVWLLTKALYVVFFLYNHPDTALADSWILHFLALPASPVLLSSRPWTLLTYMFLHLDFWHILFNMLWLFWFGRIFMEYLSARRLLIVYIAGGLAGGLIYIAAYNIFPVFQPVLQTSIALGASASVMAIVTAISFYVPDYSIRLLFVGRIRILYLAVILFIFDFFAIPTGNSGGHLAHIGGAVFGFIFAVWIRKNKFSISPGIFNRIGRSLKSMLGSRSSGSYSYSTAARPKSDSEYNAEKISKQKRIDSILEKISHGGYDSLTKEEKEFLFKSSGKNS